MDLGAPRAPFRNGEHRDRGQARGTNQAARTPPPRRRRNVSRRTSGYRDVQSLFEWQQSHREESMLSRGCVAEPSAAAE